MNMVQIVSAAREQLSILTGLKVDTVSRVDREGGGWVVDIEMVELQRVPSSNDVLASYRINLDAKGSMVSYVRTHRYKRSEVRT
ncbi:MAG: gas vesicle protein GvpO [Chloroflexales bacterium]|jgi:Gas vesicle synthesis protein GvpO